MTSATFRDSMSALGWSRREPDLAPPPPARSSTPLVNRLQSLNPFAGRDRAGYVSLPTHENPGAPLPAPTRREEEEGFFAREFQQPIPDILLDAPGVTTGRVPAWPLVACSSVHVPGRTARPVVVISWSGWSRLVRSGLVVDADRTADRVSRAVGLARTVPFTRLDLPVSKT